mmetsp:Transcript_27487/g.64136  ORF Transcript_27487/g.64136 Transcript_27487/m.64136 type:complete len:481 (-) Transcript_27487:1230-2672(-)
MWASCVLAPTATGPSAAPSSGAVCSPTSTSRRVSIACSCITSVSCTLTSAPSASERDSASERASLGSRSGAAPAASEATARSTSSRPTRQSCRRSASESEAQKARSALWSTPLSSSARCRRAVPRVLRPSRSAPPSPPSCKHRCMRASRSRLLVTLEPSSMSSLLTICLFSSSAACSMADSASTISTSTLTSISQPSASDPSNVDADSATCVTLDAGKPACTMALTYSRSASRGSTGSALDEQLLCTFCRWPMARECCLSAKQASAHTSCSSSACSESSLSRASSSSCCAMASAPSGSVSSSCCAASVCALHRMRAIDQRCRGATGPSASAPPMGEPGARAELGEHSWSAACRKASLSGARACADAWWKAGGSGGSEPEWTAKWRCHTNLCPSSYATRSGAWLTSMELMSGSSTPPPARDSCRTSSSQSSPLHCSIWPSPLALAGNPSSRNVACSRSASARSSCRTTCRSACSPRPSACA